MTFSLTGLAYLSLFFSLAFLSLRFFQHWRQRKDTTSKLFFLLILPFTLFSLVRSISVFFFADNPQVLMASIVIVAFLQSLSAAVVAYLIIYLKFHKISPWLGFAVILFLGLLVTIMTTNIQYSPGFEKEGFFGWGFPSSELLIAYSVLRFLIIMASFIPLIFILFQQFLLAQDEFIKKRSLGLSLIVFLATILGFIDFILNHLLKLETAIYRDYITIVVAFLIFLIVLLTQKPQQFGPRNL